MTGSPQREVCLLDVLEETRIVAVLPGLCPRAVDPLGDIDRVVGFHVAATERAVGHYVRIGAERYLRYAPGEERLPPTTSIVLAPEAADMTVIGFLSVSPVREGSLSSEVAKAVAALEDFDVGYETTAMGTIIDAEDIDELLAAVGAAHKAVDGDRVSTFLKIDDKRSSEESARSKVESVAGELGREPSRDR